MTLALTSYLIYNILAGIGFSISYLRTEKKIIDLTGFLLLLLFPAVGLGKWRYSQKLRQSEKPEFPEGWFVWKYMIRLNWVYLALMVVVFILALFGFAGLFDGPGRTQDAHPFDMFVDIFAAFGALLLGFAMLVSAAFVFALMFVLLILIPRVVMKNIETETYKKMYLLEKEKKLRSNDSI